MEYNLRKKVEQLAGEVFDNMYVRHYPNREDAAVALTAPDWVHGIIHEVHVTMDAGPDSRIYDFVYKAAGVIVDTADPVSPYGSLRELEASIVVAELTGWLNEHVENLEYLHSMLTAESGPPESGLALLQAAQRVHMCDVGVAFIDALVERAKELMEDDDGE